MDIYIYRIIYLMTHKQYVRNDTYKVWECDCGKIDVLKLMLAHWLSEGKINPSNTNINLSFFTSLHTSNMLSVRRMIIYEPQSPLALFVGFTYLQRLKNAWPERNTTQLAEMSIDP